jgi:hypothetical protein
MEFTDVQLTITVVVLMAAALLVLFDYRRKQPSRQRPQLVRTRLTPRPRLVWPAVQLNTATLEYSPARRVAGEWRIDPVVASGASEPAVAATIVSEPVSIRTAPPAAPRETVTIEFTTLLDPAAGSSDRLSEAQPANRLPAFTIDAELWERLISSMPCHDLLTAGDAQPKPEIDVAPGALTADYQLIENESESAWPKGVIQQSEFRKLLAGGESFSGLVVSIGVNDTDSGAQHSQGLMHSVGAYLGELLREADFSCRADYDEFIVVCPGETGAQAQRRLSHISERLWDYQLRGMSTCSILFSWGGVLVQDQPLAEAVASAVDRMRQTRRLSAASTLTRLHRTAV